MVNNFLAKSCWKESAAVCPNTPVTASGLLSLSRESFAQAHFWKHKAAAQRLWGCAGLSTRQILPAESGIREHLL